MRAVIGVYARISQDLDGDALGVQRQLLDARKLADLRGWTVRREYVDNNVSAYKRGVVRPSFERMVADLQRGDIEGIVAYDMDRIARRLKDLVGLIDIYEDHPRYVFATVQGDIDLSGDGATMASFMVTIANKSSRDTARRVRRKILANAQEGKPHGGPRPFGYAADLMTLDPLEAPVVRDMGLKFIAGHSYREIAWQLNESGTLTRTGKTWYADTVKKFINRPRNAGFRVVAGERFEGKWQPIFTPEEWEAIQRTVARRKQDLKLRPNNRRYLLTGLLKCSRCGGFLYGMTKRSSKDGPLQPTYQCRGWSDTSRTSGHCGGMVVGATPLDHFVRELICARLDTPDLLEALSDVNSEDHALRALYARQTELRGNRDAVIDAFADSPLAPGDMRRMIERIDRQLEEVERDITASRRSRLRIDLNAGETVRQAWERNPNGWRRELIEVLVRNITVVSSTRKPYYDVEGVRYRFDPERVVVDWKV